MMGRTLALVLLAASWGLAGCGGGEPETAAKAPVATVSGTYKVEGTTIDKKSGAKRAISGTIILAQEGDRYTATFDLDTTYPTPDGNLPADVIGKGEGQIEGNVLKGTAQTQLVMGTVKGVDTAFAFVPRMVSARIRTTSVATLLPDGTIEVEIENQPAPGETQYKPTHTKLRGSRTPGANLPGD